MKVIVQRVRSATLHVQGDHRADCGTGLVALAGIEAEDTDRELRWMAEKVVHLRIFPDAEGRMNRSVLDIGGDVLLVPNFTVAGDCRKGRRPSFSTAKSPEVASPMFDQFVTMVEGLGVPVATGEFGADMLVTIGNDGPITLILESPRSSPDA